MDDNEREQEQRRLRIVAGRLNGSRKALEGLVVIGDPWATYRLSEVETALTDTQRQLTDLQLEAKEGVK